MNDHHPLSYLFESIAESVKDFLNVATLLHGNDTSMILLVNPDEEVLLVVVPYSSSIRPVPTHPRGKQKRRHWLVKQKVILNNK
jgi:hypothetical protein